MDPSQRPDNSEPGESIEPNRPSMPKLLPFKQEGIGETPQPAQYVPPQPSPSGRPVQTGYPAPGPAPGMGQVVGGFDPLGGGQLPQHGAIPEPVADYNYRPPRFARKMVLGIVLPLVLIAGGAAAYYFAYYVPNKPENIFKTSLTRTGAALNGLSTSINDQKQFDKFKFSEFSGSAVVEGPNGRQSGTLNSKYNAETSTSKLTYSPDNKGKDLVVEVQSSLSDIATYPDVYINIAGMSALGLDKSYPNAAKYDGKWLHASEDFWKKLLPETEAEADTKDKEEFSSRDLAAMFKIIVDTSNEYVLSSDPAKNVLVIRSIKGAETLNDQPVIHYVVGFHKEHSKQYCKVLATRLLESDAYKRVPYAPQDNKDELKKNIDKTCTENIQQLKDDYTIDMWVSRQTKLVSQVRIPDQYIDGNYTDFGQNYVSGNSFPMYLVSHSDRDEYHVKLTTDVDFTRTVSKSTIAADFKYGPKKDKWKVNLTLSSKPYDDDIKVTAPKVVVPVTEFLEALGLGGIINNGTVADAPSGSPLSETQDKAKDTERRTDLKSIQGQLEAYYAQNGSYPAVADVNNAAWRKTNMGGLSDQSLADPDGKLVELLNGKSSSTMYGYELSECDTSTAKCQGYILTSMLSDGALYTINSLN